jgi:hypothetical protein
MTLASLVGIVEDLVGFLGAAGRAAIGGKVFGGS